MRDKLQALVDYWKEEVNEVGDCCDHNTKRAAIDAIESILATEPLAVTVRAGWYAKDFLGVHWFERKPTWFGEWDYEIEVRGKFASAEDIGGRITDPWPDKPNGGPECLLEVK